MKDISRHVTMICSTCGNNQFETLDSEYQDMKEAPDTSRYKCSDCGRVFNKSELIDENQEIINANIEDIEKEVIDELDQKLKKALKRLGR